MSRPEKETDKELMRIAAFNQAQRNVAETTRQALGYRPDKYGRQQTTPAAVRYNVVAVRRVTDMGQKTANERTLLIEAGQRIAALLEECADDHHAAGAALMAWATICELVYSDLR